jgi:hypothetical protein
VHPRIRELVEYLDTQRALLRAAFDAVSAGEWERPPALFGPLSLYQRIAFAGAHEARHAAQIRVIGAALGGRSRQLTVSAGTPRDGLCRSRHRASRVPLLFGNRL